MMRLGLRLLRPRGLTEIVSAAWVVVSTAVLLSSLFVVGDFLGSLNHREAVLWSRTPVGADSPERRKSLPQGVEQGYDVGGASLIRLLVGPSYGQVTPPSGIPRWPAPGEVIASPAAVRLINKNPYAAALAPGRIVSAVDRKALRDPDEAYVVVGATAEQVQATGSSSAISMPHLPYFLNGNLEPSNLFSGRMKAER